MPTIGFDCQIILDGTGYFVAPDTYSMTRPKQAVAKATRGTLTALSPFPTDEPVRTLLPPLPPVNSGVPIKIVDRGPSMRQWTMDVLCLNTLTRYNGTAMGPIGQELRDLLHESYDKLEVALNFTAPHGGTFLVAFMDYKEKISDLRTQVLGIDYIVTITLLESE